MSNAGEEEDERVGASCGKVDDVKSEADRKLFTQPDGSHLGECPLCFLPLPLDPQKSMFHTCCSEVFCKGCVYANCMSNINDLEKARRCPFCRGLPNDDENDKRMMKRVKANDPAALSEMGVIRYEDGDLGGAFECWTKAAELGDLKAHYNIGVMYRDGDGVEKDEDKAVHHYEKAAIGGHPIARYNLACYEGRSGNTKRAVKHFIIAAKLGDEESMKSLWLEFKDGNITKEDLDATLRSHQAAMDAMKSSQRDAAEVVWGTVP